jgi:hypothetical protein
MQVILLTATATMPTTLQITLSAPQCTSGYPCVGQFYPSATPTATPIPHHDNKFPASSVVPSIFSWPPDFAPNADDIWDIIGGALPLINTPATSLNQIANNIVNTGSNAINAVSNTVTNTGAAVNEAIGNGLNYGPVMPIFIIPSPYDLFPITSQGPVYN